MSAIIYNTNIGQESSNLHNLNINLQLLDNSIFKIQKAIYIAAKDCKINKIYKNQSAFFTQREFLLGIISKTVFILGRKDNFAKAYCEKLVLAIYFKLFARRDSQPIIVHFVKSIIFQECAMLLIKPEWEARYEPFLFKNNYAQIAKRFATKLFQKASFYQSTCSIKITIETNIKNIYRDWVQKIFNSCQLSSQFIFWLNKSSFMHDSLKPKNILPFWGNQNTFKSFLKEILYIGMEWCLYLNFKSQCLYRYFYCISQSSYLYCISTISRIAFAVKFVALFLHHVNINLQSIKFVVYYYSTNYIYLNGVELIVKNAKILFKLSKASMKYVFYVIRNKLYHKNSKNHWRISNSSDSFKAMLSIQKILSQWYIHYVNILDNKNILFMQNTVNKMFYKWQMKK